MLFGQSQSLARLEVPGGFFVSVEGNIRTAVALAAVVWTSAALADFLPVVNGSFESPTTTFVSTTITGWTFDGPPDTGVAGVFTNNSTAPDSPAHIQNAVGSQLAFISTETGNELTQIIPLASFEPGKQYILSVGIVTSYTLPPLATDALRFALYYPDAAGHRHFVASKDIFNNAENDLSSSIVKYFTARSGIIGENDPAVGQPIGIELTTIGASGHYLDMENVTVEAQDAVSAAEQLVTDFPEKMPSIAATPEPGLLSLMGLLVLVLMSGRRGGPVAQMFG